MATDAETESRELISSAWPDDDINDDYGGGDDDDVACLVDYIFVKHLCSNGLSLAHQLHWWSNSLF